jgi:hypothetical protein
MGFFGASSYGKVPRKREDLMTRGVGRLRFVIRVVRGGDFCVWRA